jgi:hypothetical protein
LILTDIGNLENAYYMPPDESLYDESLTGLKRLAQEFGVEPYNGDEAHNAAKRELRQKIERLKQSINTQLLKNHRCQQLASRLVVVHRFTRYRHAHARAYRSLTRNASASREDGGNGDSDGSDPEPPARRYYPLVTLSIPKLHSSLLAVITPRLLPLGLSERPAIKCQARNSMFKA